MKKPNFLIVGAAKCGTTSLYHYLKQHSEIFMPENFKEPQFFVRKKSPEDYINIFMIMLNIIICLKMLKSNALEKQVFFIYFFTKKQLKIFYKN